MSKHSGGRTYLSKGFVAILQSGNKCSIWIVRFRTENVALGCRCLLFSVDRKKMFSYTLVINASKNRFAASHIEVITKANHMLRKKRPRLAGKSGRVEDRGILALRQ